MDLTRKPEAAGEFSVELHRDLADKMLEAERSLIELAREMGISVEALRRWSRTVESAQGAGSDADDTLVPSSQVRDLEQKIEKLKAPPRPPGRPDPDPEGPVTFGLTIKRSLGSKGRSLFDQGGLLIRSDTDWRSIAAFRNVAVHGYLGIYLTQIWEMEGVILLFSTDEY